MPAAGGSGAAAVRDVLAAIGVPILQYFPVILEVMTFGSPRSPTPISAARSRSLSTISSHRRGPANRRPDLVLNSGDISLDGASNEPDLAVGAHPARRARPPVALPAGQPRLGDCQDAPSHGEGAIDATRRARYLRHFGAGLVDARRAGLAPARRQCPAPWQRPRRGQEQDAAVAERPRQPGSRRSSRSSFTSRCSTSSGRRERVAGRFVNPAPRRALLASLGGRRRPWSPAAMSISIARPGRQACATCGARRPLS